MGEQVEQCQKCAVLERELDNVKKDVDEMRIDMRGFQRMTQEVEIKYSKIEILTCQYILFVLFFLREWCMRNISPNRCGGYS